MGEEEGLKLDDGLEKCLCDVLFCLVPIDWCVFWDIFLVDCFHGFVSFGLI